MPQPKSQRLLSIDVFRGMVIFLMLFVNMVAMLGDLPGIGRWLGSAPVSVWRHASCAYDPPVWRGYEPADGWRGGTVIARHTDGTYDVAVKNADGTDVQTTASAMTIVSPKPLCDNAPVIVQWNAQTQQPDAVQFPENGCTFVDLVAPFFVFIVGVCIPFSHRSRKQGWWKHVLSRAGLLIGLGYVDMSLGAGISYWWGILQAIGLAYLVAAFFDLLQYHWQKIILVCVLAFGSAFLSLHYPWWTFVGDPNYPPFSIHNLTGCDFLRPLNAHCTPWAGLAGYGICACIGAAIGSTMLNGDKARLLRWLPGSLCLIVAGLLVSCYIIPMSKEEVTASYALFTSGLAVVVLLAVYWIIDILQIRKWSYVFTVFGANALLAFFLQPFVRIAFEKFGLLQFYYNHQGWNAMMWGLIWVFTLWAIVWYCNRRGWYWKI